MYKKFYDENPPYKSKFYTEGLVVVIGDHTYKVARIGNK